MSGTVLRVQGIPAHFSFLAEVVIQDKIFGFTLG